MKFKKVFLTILCCAMATAAFAACKKDKGGKDSTSQNWLSQGTNTPNTPNNPNNSNPQTPVAPVVKTVTEEQWNSIFTTILDVNNVTVNKEEMDENGNKQTYIMTIAGDRLCDKSVYNGDERARYYVNKDGKNYVYSQNANGEWETKLYEDEDFSCSLSVIGYLFEEIAPMYAKLQFDQTTGLYVGTDIPWVNGGGAFSFVSVAFANGKLASISLQYDGGSESYTFSNYGTTKVALPDEQEESGGNEEEGGDDLLPPDAQEWTEADWKLALENLLNTTSGSMTTRDWVYEDGVLVCENSEWKTVEDGQKLYLHKYEWNDYGYEDDCEYYYENANGTDYIYEYVENAWVKSEAPFVRYSFYELMWDWHYEVVLQSLSQLQYNGEAYYAEDFYFEEGEKVHFDDITIKVEKGRITDIEFNSHSDWTETVSIHIDYDNATVNIPYVQGDNNEDGGGDVVDPENPDVGGNEEGGGNTEPDNPDDGDGSENNFYLVTILREEGSPSGKYYVQFTYGDSTCFPAIELDENDQAYFYPEHYGWRPEIYTIHVMDEDFNDLVIDGPSVTEAEYGEYTLVVKAAEMGDLEQPSISEEEWNTVFENTLAATDVTMRMEREKEATEEEQNWYYTSMLETQKIIRLDDGCRKYSFLYNIYEHMPTNNSYYSNVNGIDYVYLWDITSDTYSYEPSSITVEYTLKELEDDLAVFQQVFYSLLYNVSTGEYCAYNVGATDDFTEIFEMKVNISDGYVSRLYLSGIDCDGMNLTVEYTFTDYNCTDVILPEATANFDEGISEEEWNTVFENTLAATDVSVNMYSRAEEDSYMIEYCGTINLDDGCKKYNLLYPTSGTPISNDYYYYFNGVDYHYIWDFYSNTYSYEPSTVAVEYTLRELEDDLAVFQQVFHSMSYNVSTGEYYAYNIGATDDFTEIFEIKVSVSDCYVLHLYLSGIDYDGMNLTVEYTFTDYNCTDVILPEATANFDDSISEEEWNAAFEATRAATDFFLDGYIEIDDKGVWANIKVDDGCRKYKCTEEYSHLTGEWSNYTEQYCERIGAYDYVYEYVAAEDNYQVHETTLDDAEYSCSQDGILLNVQNKYSKLEYQGMGRFSSGDQIEVVLADGYVQKIYINSMDGNGCSRSVLYNFYDYGSTTVEMPGSSEEPEAPENDWVTTY